MGSTDVPNLIPEMTGPQSSSAAGTEAAAEFRSCVKVEVAVLGSPSLIVLMVSVA